MSESRSCASQSRLDSTELTVAGRSVVRNRVNLGMGSTEARCCKVIAAVGMRLVDHMCLGLVATVVEGERDFKTHPS